VGSNPIGGAGWISRTCVGWALASPGGRNPPAFGLWRFNSVPTHFHASGEHSQAGGSPVGPHEADFPVRVRGLGFCGRAGAQPSFIRSEDGFNSHARNPRFDRPGRQTGKAASSRSWCVWVRLPPRLLDFVFDDVPWSNGRAPGLHPGDGGSIPSGMTRGRVGRLCDGRLVQREDAWPATRRSGFDSPAGPLSVSMEGSRIRFAGPLC
jgi:hypothetical protein